MFQKVIAALLVSTTFGLTCPVMAQDFGTSSAQKATVNANLIPKRVSFGRQFAFAPPQAAQSTPAKSGSGELTTGGKIMKWVGVGLMGEGALVGAYGLTVKDPCDGFGSSYYCTSNYTTVRATYFVSGGISIIAGAILFVVGNHKRQ